MIGNPETNYVGQGGPGGFGFGGGGFGAFGLVGLIGLLNGRRGLDGGDGDGCGQKIVETAILSKLGDIQNEISNSSCTTENVVAATGANIKDTIQNQTLFLQNLANQSQIATLQGFASVKDTLQNGFALTSSQNCETQNLIQATACSIKQAINEDGNLTRALINQNTIADLRDELSEERHTRRGRESEINITQTVNQNQAQAQAQQQQQAQFSALFAQFHALANELQIQRQVAANRVVQFGTGNVAVPTNTNTANQVG